MQFWLVLFTFVFSNAAFALDTADSALERLIADRDFVQAQDVLTKMIAKEHSVQKKAEHLVTLSCVYIKDQKEELAFQTYLSALEMQKQVVTLNSSEEQSETQSLEQSFFETYLQKYLQVPQPTKEQSEEFAKELLLQIKKHPNYHGLKLLYACSLANRKLYEEFFTTFFSAYTQCSDCYLVPRTIAILNLKLFERARTCEEKELLRNTIMKSLQLALQKYDQDPTVYKLLLAYAPEQSRKSVYKEVLQKIHASTTITTRSEISFYINCALAVEEYDIAQKILEKMKAVHGYSRVIEELEQEVRDRSRIN